MERERKKGLSGSSLKLIAMVTMLIDHIGATILWKMMQLRAAESGLEGMVIADELYTVYRFMRDIGRIAFPIYCFLLVEGLVKTSNRARYALRLGMFAIFSEIPFDLAFNSQILEFSYQNIFFTLLIGFLGMWVADEIEKMKGFGIWSFLSGLLVTAVGAGIAEILGTDYGAKGVLAIMVLYLFRHNKWEQIIAGCLAFLWETTAPIAFLPIWFYNGKRGLNVKYVFYLFYPLHLLILYLICFCMGLSGY